MAYLHVAHGRGGSLEGNAYELLGNGQGMEELNDDNHWRYCAGDEAIGRRGAAAAAAPRLPGEVDPRIETERVKADSLNCH